MTDKSDTGGPVVQTVNGVPTVVGVVNYYSKGCQTPSGYAGAVQVSKFVDWITATVTANG